MRERYVYQTFLDVKLTWLLFAYFSAVFWALVNATAVEKMEGARRDDGAAAIAAEVTC